MTKMRLAVGVALALPCVVLAVQVRDAQTPPESGIGIIRGAVVSTDSPPRPIGRAIVMLGGVTNGRTVIADDQGRFEFSGLPAGQFTITARKIAYLPAAYGSARPGRPGTPIALAAGQTLVVTLSMARGAVVTGTVRDAAGQPLTGARVSVIDVLDPAGFDRAYQTAEAVTTDDRGLYRVFGLAQSEYVVAAIQEATGAGEIGRRASAETDRLLAELLQQRGRPPASTPPIPRPQPRSFTFGPTYFPGTPLLREAARLRLLPGDVREGVDVTMTAVPVARIYGTVSGNVPNLAAVRLSLILDGIRLPLAPGTTPVLSQAPDAAGRFSYSNAAPGRYRILARANRQETAPPPTPGGASTSMGRGSTNPNVAPGDLLFAVADVDISGQDVTVSLTLQPGSTIAGRVRFEGETQVPANAMSLIRLSASPPDGTYSSSASGTTIGNTFIGGSAATPNADGTFEIRNIGPGIVSIWSPLPAAITSQWWMRSAMAADVDLLDAPFEMTLGVDIRDVVVTLSDRRTELTGTLQTPAGEAAPAYFIIVFPADPAARVPRSRRIQVVRPSTAGAFVARDLPPGDYLVAALADVVPNEWNNPGFLDQVAPAGVKVTIREGEKTIQNLQIAR